MDLGDVPSSSKDDDYQKEFKILGQTEFEPLKKIKYGSQFFSYICLCPFQSRSTYFFFIHMTGPIKKARFSVTTSWVSNASLFPADIVKENLAELSYVNGLPEPIANLVKQKIESWFPVQVSQAIPVALSVVYAFYLPIGSFSPFYLHF